MDALPDGLPAGLGDYARMSEVVRAVRDGLDDIRATAYSPDGLIAATVDGRGLLAELDLDPRIYRDQDSAALGKTITDTIREATRDAIREAAGIAARLLPGIDPEDIDPQVDPVLRILDTEAERSRGSWHR